MCYKLQNDAELQARVVADTAIEPEAEEYCHAEYADLMMQASRDGSLAFKYQLQL